MDAIKAIGGGHKVFNPSTVQYEGVPWKLYMERERHNMVMDALDAAIHEDDYYYRRYRP